MNNMSAKPYEQDVIYYRQSKLLTFSRPNSRQSAFVRSIFKACIILARFGDGTSDWSPWTETSKVTDLFNLGVSETRVDSKTGHVVDLRSATGVCCCDSPAEPGTGIGIIRCVSNLSGVVASASTKRIKV